MSVDNSRGLQKPQERPSDSAGQSGHTEPPHSSESPEAGETEPLLGHRGADAGSMLANVVTGSAIIAQVGIWILAALVWNGILSHPLLFFSPHPLLNSVALILLTQAILLLQPTTTPTQKRRGTLLHFSFALASLVAFTTAATIIELNKADHPETRFKSPHAILGGIVYLLLLVQALVGAAQTFAPHLVFGSVDRAKSVYKYHRWSGYAVLVLGLATVLTATRTTYNVRVLHIPLWGTSVASVLVVAGLGARIRKHKLGL